MTITSESKRIAYFDFLRVFATFAIMIQHINPFGSKDPRTAEYGVRLVSDLLSRCGVPLFLMISGSLFLSGKSSIKRIYTHNILRIVTAFLFWSALYAVVREIIFKYGKINMVLEFLLGHYHMWFMFLIVELYVLTPILRKVVNSWSITKYLLIILCVYASLIPMLKESLTLVSPRLGDFSDILGQKYLKNEFHIGIFYFVLGYYLSKCQLTVCRRRCIYGIGVLGAVIAGVGSYVLAITGVENLPLLNNHHLTIIAFSSAVFVFARTHCSFDRMKDWAVALVLRLSKYSFGAYLVHALVLEMLRHFIGDRFFQIGALFSLPYQFLTVCVLSFAISAIINHIPVLRKYVV